MTQAEILFDRLFIIEPSISPLQRAMLLSSFVETYNHSALMREKMAALEGRLSSLPQPHQKIAIRETKGDT